MEHRRSGGLLLLVAAVVGVVTACGPRVVRPPRVSSTEPIEVVVIRPKNDGGLAVQVTLDDTTVATMKSGESASFRIDPGPHTIGARVYRFPSFFSKGSTRFDAVAGNTHFFTVNAGTFNMPPYVMPLDAATGQRQATDGTPLPVGP